MDNNRFIEYETIIRTALQLSGFNEKVVIFPGNQSENNIYIGSKRRKDCLIEATLHHLVVLLPYNVVNYLDITKAYEVVDRIDLSEPNSLERLGDVLSKVLSNRI